MVWWNTTGKPCRTMTPHSRGPMSIAMTGPPANWGRCAHSVTRMGHSCLIDRVAVEVMDVVMNVEGTGEMMHGEVNDDTDIMMEVGC
jgi:hypothetical protein